MYKEEEEKSVIHSEWRLNGRRETWAEFKEAGNWGLRDYCGLRVKMSKLEHLSISEDKEAAEGGGKMMGCENGLPCVCPDWLNSWYTFCEPQLSCLEIGR